MRTPALACLLVIPYLQPAVGAQTRPVLLSEVFAEGSDRWIELHNRSNADVDVSAWSLYYASHTPGMPQTYWWAFPAGANVPAGGYVRVHWLQARPATPVPGEYATGNTVYDFLFGLGSEVLRPERGALALLHSQHNAEMGDPSIVEDWVEWGEAGFARESLAVTAQRWLAGRSTGAIPAGSSLARNETLVGTAADPVAEWFLDPSPTPGGPNLPGSSVHAYGQPCTVFGNHLLGAPELSATSVPILGNRAFGLRVTDTTGLFGETLLVAFTYGAAPAGLPSLLPPVPAGPPCRELVDPRFVLGSMWTRTTAGSTSLPLPLQGLPPALSGLHFHVQAMVFDYFPGAWPPYQGTTNALEVVLGN